MACCARQHLRHKCPLLAQRKVAANFKRTGPNLLGFCILPVAATVWYADNYREHEKYEHRY